VPTECKIEFENTEKNDDCNKPQAYELIVKGDLDCKNICYVGINKENGKEKNILFESRNETILMLQHMDQQETYNTSVYFYGIDKYTITRANLYKGIIQAVIKSGNQRILGFIDIKENRNPTVATKIGKWALSDAFLRDEDTVVVVKVDDDNKILESNVSMSHPKLVWRLIDYNPNRKIKRIEIHDDYIHVSDNGQLFKIPLFPEAKLPKQKEGTKHTISNETVQESSVMSWDSIHPFLKIAGMTIFIILALAIIMSCYMCREQFIFPLLGKLRIKKFRPLPKHTRRVLKGVVDDLKDLSEEEQIERAKEIEKLVKRHGIALSSDTDSGRNHGRSRGNNSSSGD